MMATLTGGRTFFRREMDSDVEDPFLWLEGSDLYPKWYWENREGTTRIASVGSVHSQKDVPAFSESASSDIRFFGAFHACQENDPLWGGFAMSSFFLPLFEWSHREGQTTLAAHSSKKESFPSFPSYSKPVKTKKLSLSAREDLPSPSTWQKNVANALEWVEKKHLEKVVPARRSSFTFSSSPSPISALEKLRKIKRNSYLFLYQPNPHLAFVGASPEPLYRRKGRSLFTEAIAGTRKRGDTKEEDERLRDELMDSIKEEREFLFVQEFLQKTLAPLCEKPPLLGERSIVQTPYVQHLHSKLEGMLKKSVDDLSLLSFLHPTPATLGTPSSAAARFLQEHERFSRGLYTAPIGWISSQESEFAVGIRSCLIQKETAHLFSAAGIVQGSNPLKEWDELEQKITLFKTGVWTL